MGKIVTLDIEKINDENYNSILEEFKIQFGEKFCYDDWEITAKQKN